jgi:tetratricopeptide (TPR) repeat protein
MKGIIKMLTVFVVIVILFHIPAEAAWMGVAVEDSQSDEGEKKGIKVIAVDADGPGAQAGLRVGDLIVLVDGKIVETCLSLAKIVQEVPESTSLQIILLRKGKLVITELVLAVAPQHFIFIKQGWEQVEKGNYEQAIRYFTEAIDLNHKDAESYYSRGTGYSHKGQYDQAILDFSKALEISPRNAKPYYNRGIIFYRKGEYDQAISDFNKVLEINPMDAEAYYNRGITYCKKGQHDQAIFDFKKAFEINPNNPRYLVTYVDHEIAYFEDKGQYDQAISNYTKALEINPRDAKVYINRGRAYYLKGEYDRSWEDFRKALDLDEKVPSKFLDELGKVSRRGNIKD